MHKNHVSTYFIVQSVSMSPDSLSEKIWMNFDNCQILWKNVVSPLGRMSTHTYQENAWILESNLWPQKDAEEHLMAIITRVIKFSSNIKALKGVKKIISIGVQYKEKCPSFSFNPELLEELAYMGITLNINLYDMKS